DEVVCISGDASFQMNLQELATVVQYGIATKVAIINNGWQGMVRQWQQAFYGQRYSHSNMATGMPDFVKMAESFGLQGMVVSHPDQLDDAVLAILKAEGPVLADFQVVRDENCYPMVAPGKSNAQMLGLPEKAFELSAELMYCPSCGIKNPSTHKFCADCGTKL
ncbi:MAG: thiamine pyrophosphate-dependent enzyme, partial [Cyanobacteria bacterium P01_F01_bin.33]